MRFAVGYPVIEDDDDPFVGVVAEYRDHIAEVYFAWPGEPSGRSPSGVAAGAASPEAQENLEDDLRAFRALGIKLDLLLNANCYGPSAASPQLVDHAAGIVARLASEVGLDIVTTTSPFLAAALKQRFPELKLRASVNMRLGTAQAMSYVADAFDSYYLQRDYNRDPERIAEVSGWCRRHGKELCLLANSGCLRFCSGQTFHDNLVAHEGEMTQPAPRDALVCRRFLTNPAHWVALMQATWIRPEDLRCYEQWFSLAKLATRMHHHPRRVVQAYALGRFPGNLLDLLEPGYQDLLGGHILDNTRFPQHWHERINSCRGRCEECSYCEEVLRNVLLRVGNAWGASRRA
jgi:collagenase-like PrtC family protease